MHFLHKVLNLAAGDEVKVILNHPANVQLLDPENYELYRAGHRYTYHGGHFTESPAFITPPSPGEWHLTVDLGGGVGSVRASVQILSAQVA